VLTKSAYTYCADAAACCDRKIDLLVHPSKKEASMATHPMISIGSTGPAVKDAQQNLVDRGYPVGPTGVDGIFGFHTRHAVIMYQTDRSTGHPLALSFPLAIDGIVGPQTWARLDPDTVRKGDSGSGVYLLQSILKSSGNPNFDPGPVDGIFGPHTEMAVKSFQAFVSILIDGIVGPQTWTKLKS
jgi:peptidoglycan hydrolase-like protein with peptidoglycan-binding domain